MRIASVLRARDRHSLRVYAGSKRQVVQCTSRLKIAAYPVSVEGCRRMQGDATLAVFGERKLVEPMQAIVCRGMSDEPTPAGSGNKPHNLQIGLALLFWFRWFRRFRFDGVNARAGIRNANRRIRNASPSRNPLRIPRIKRDQMVLRRPCARA